MDLVTDRQVQNKYDAKENRPELIRVPVLVSQKDFPKADPAKRLSARMFRVLDALGQDTPALVKGRWSPSRLAMANELFTMLDMTITARICMLWSLSHLKPIEESIQISRDKLADAVLNESSDLKEIAAMIQAQTSLIKAHRENLDQIMDFAAKAQEMKGRDRPKNLPPTVALQVNVAGTPSPSPVPATLGPKAVTVEAKEPQPQKT